MKDVEKNYNSTPKAEVAYSYLPAIVQAANSDAAAPKNLFKRLMGVGIFQQPQERLEESPTKKLAERRTKKLSLVVLR